MTFKVDDRVREVSTTTGTGTYTLGGAVAGFRAFSVLGANNYTRYFATDGTNSEWGIGRYLSGPDRLERTTIHGSTNAGAAVNWGVGSRTLRCGPIASMDVPRVLSLSVAGGAGTTILTQDQQRRDIMEFTGVLTGNRIIEVDDTPWSWIVYNNTTGAFSLTFRVTGQTGVALQRGRRTVAYCDSVDVRHGQNVMQRKAADVVAAGTIDLNVDGDVVDVTGNTSITAITLEEGREVTARFTGTPTITNGASLVLPGGGNIVAAAGDFGTFRGYAAGVVRCTSYFQAATGAYINAASDTARGAIEIATQAEMETGTDATRAVTPGRQHFHPSAAKAWIRFSGDGTTNNGSYNVSSLTDSGAGLWTVNFTTAFSGVGYAVSATSIRSGSQLPMTPTLAVASSCSLEVVNSAFSANVDSSGNFAAFHGDQ
jgi:hypothetical protein